MRALFSACLAIIVLVTSSFAWAAPPTAADELARGEVQLRAAESESSTSEKNKKALVALQSFESSYDIGPTWRAAAGAMDASLVIGSPHAAAGWYWLAADVADYSESYLAWQKTALARVFEGRATYAFDFDEAPASLRIDGIAVPAGSLDRALAFEPGIHSVSAISQDGNRFQGTLEVAKEDVGTRKFFTVVFEKVLKAGEIDPNAPQGQTRPTPESSGMSTLQIVTVVGTIALASAIAVGGGYLLLGEDNPRGFDSAGGVAVIVTELLVIGGGAAIALISD